MGPWLKCDLVFGGFASVFGKSGTVGRSLQKTVVDIAIVAGFGITAWRCTLTERQSR